LRISAGTWCRSRITLYSVWTVMCVIIMAGQKVESCYLIRLLRASLNFLQATTTTTTPLTKAQLLPQQQQQRRLLLLLLLLLRLRIHMLLTVLVARVMITGRPRGHGHAKPLYLTSTRRVIIPPSC